ncbi:hypothetical protein CXG81DRAFT_15343 [Caulochytrium protostelioides]|uniref:Eukaryotic translation initiation factor 2A n=1 Tax=Caulochytrium protostelioides TaxID=1555241 RepID=A0A4P9WZD4_9FUNG|nr:hypothetical protein CXG81DRAFT_15343 [Caulochytrium protostelioides]|eukprot:RKO98864.1 hypothetical protein CXG81DRAFT_15343 [Caulochytrium protostelioides]
MAYQDRVCILRASDDSDYAPVFDEAFDGVMDIEWSPAGNYLSVLTRWNKQQGARDTGTPHRNLLLYEVDERGDAEPAAQQIAAYTEKFTFRWNVTWAPNAELFGRQESNTVFLYRTAEPTRYFTHITVPRMTAYTLSPGARPSLVAFVPEKGSEAACLVAYDVAAIATADAGKKPLPLAQKRFFRADSVEFSWNARGSSLLALTKTEVDATGKTYYGETSLYYMSLVPGKTFDCRVDLPKQGPVHDVKWHPEGREFAVTYGTMPSRTSIFDVRANVAHTFPEASRNTIAYSPGGRLLALGGFGNLSGEIDIWDRTTLKKVSTFTASNASLCEWSPTGRHLLTAILYRRLKVDNGVTIWHHSGRLLQQLATKELYDVAWRPAQPAETAAWPETRALSPPPAGLAAQPAKKSSAPYRPPGMRHLPIGGPAAAVRTVPGQRAPAARTIPGMTPKPPSTEDVSTADLSTPDGVAKRIKAVTRKIKKIAGVEEKQRAGESINPQQQSMLATRPAVEKELADLQARLAAM